MNKCKNCGNELNKNDNFCKKCGTEVENISEHSCSNCGFNYAVGDNFCKKCGTKIEAKIPISNEEKDDFKFDYSKPYDELYDNVKEPKSDPIDHSVSDKDMDITREIPISDAEFTDDELDIPAFFKKSKKTVDNLFSGDKKYESERISDDIEEEIETISEEPKEEFSQDSKDHTVLLPSLDDYEQGSRFEDRVVLSEEKKRLIKESKEKADTINHDIEEPQTSEEELTSTQKIRLADSERQIENRKVRTVKTSDEDKKVKTETEKKDKKPFKLSTFILPALIVLAVCSVLYATASGLTDKKRVISRFEDAVANENIQNLQKVVVSSDEDLPITEERLAPFVKLMKSDQIYRSSLIGAIKEDSSKLSIDENYKSERNYRLESVGSKYLFFKDYKVILDPLLLSVAAPEGSNYTLAGEQYTGNADNIKLFPGIYSLLNNTNNETYEVNVSPTNDNMQMGHLNINLASLTPAVAETSPEQPEQTAPQEEPAPTDNNKWAGETEFHIDTTQKDARVFINNEDTGLTVTEYNEIPLKSVVSGDKIKLAIDYPWGTGYSEEVTLSGEALLSLYVDMDNEATMNHIISRIEKMLKEDGMARRNMSMDGFTTIIEPELSTTQSIIQTGIDNGMTYYRVYDNFYYDPSSFSVESGENGAYTAYIGGRLNFHATEFPKGSSIEDGYEPYEMSQITGFHLTFDPDKNDWFINMWGETERYINLENLIDHPVGE